MDYKKRIIDLTREEGARILEEELFLYPEAKKLISRFEKAVNNEGRDDKKEEYYSSNFFIDGKRGTGKTSILLTIRELLRNSNSLKDKVELLEVVNLSVNQSGILLHLLNHINAKLENDPSSSCSDSIYEIFSKVKMGFPHYLKCSFESALKSLCELEIEELVDRLEGEFLHNFRMLIKKYKKIYGKDIVIFIDDLDLVQDKEFLYKTFLEMAVFLCIEHVHIIAAGDLENTYKVLQKFVSEKITDNQEARNLIAQSFIDKVFPLPNRVHLSLLSVLELKEIKIRWEKDPEKTKDSEKTFEEFLKLHPTFKILGKESRNLCFFIFENLSIREFIQLLRNIKERIEIIEDKKGKEGVSLEEIAISNVFSSFSSEEHYEILELPSTENITVTITEGGKIKAEVKETALQDILLYHEDLGRRLFLSVFKFSQKEEKFRDLIKIENLIDIRDKRKISFLQIINVFDRRFYALLTVWLTEIFNYARGDVFFVPYFLVLVSILYGVPNIFLYLERQVSGTSKEKEEERYRNPLEEIELLLSFPDSRELLFMLDSLDSVNVLKSYFFKGAKKFILFHNLKDSRAIPHFYKLWFFPLVVLEGEIEWFYYESFFYEEDEENEEKKKKKDKEKSSQEYEEDTLEKIKNGCLKVIKAIPCKEFNPLKIDKSIFSLVRSTFNGIFKRRIDPDTQTKTSFYYIFSLAILLATYQWEEEAKEFLGNVLSLLKEKNITELLCNFFKKHRNVRDIQLFYGKANHPEVKKCDDISKENEKPKRMEITIANTEDLLKNYLILFFSQVFSNIGVRGKIEVEVEREDQKEKMDNKSDYEKAILELLFYPVLSEKNENNQNGQEKNDEQTKQNENN
jgi:hypothetical protein